MSRQSFSTPALLKGLQAKQSWCAYQATAGMRQDSETHVLPTSIFGLNGLNPEVGS